MPQVIVELSYNAPILTDSRIWLPESGLSDARRTEVPQFPKVTFVLPIPRIVTNEPAPEFDERVVYTSTTRAGRLQNATSRTN